MVQLTREEKKKRTESKHDAGREATRRLGEPGGEMEAVLTLTGPARSSRTGANWGFPVRSGWVALSTLSPCGVSRGSRGQDTLTHALAALAARLAAVAACPAWPAEGDEKGMMTRLVGCRHQRRAAPYRAADPSPALRRARFAIGKKERGQINTNLRAANEIF